MRVSLNQLNEIFSEVMEEQVCLSKSTKRKDLEKWDSINHLNLIIELEDKFNIEFSPDEIENIDSIDYLIRIINDK